MRSQRRWVLVSVALCVGLVASLAEGTTLRIVSYNIDCADQGSDNNITGSSHSVPTVIRAIGLHHIGANAQPVDVLGLEELTSTSLSNLVVQLNNIYGAGTCAFDPTADPNTGGGPDGLIYRTNTVQVVSARALRTGQTVLLQSNGTYTAAHSPCGGVNGVVRAPMVYRLRPVGAGTNNDFYIYVSHARSTSDDSCGDARYAEAQEVRSDAKYNLPAGAHIIYSGDWNLFNGSGENAYKCLTGQTTSDGIDWSDGSSIWANTNPTQAYDPMSKTQPPTTVTWANTSGDNASYLYGDSTASLTSRIDIHLVNGPMLSVYNGQGGTQLAPDTADPFDSSNFPSAQYPYAFETFGNNGSTPRGSSVTSSSNHSLDDLTNTVPNAATVYADLLLTGSGSTFTGSDHYPIVGDYVVSAPSSPPLANFTASPTNGTAPLTVTFTDASTGTSPLSLAWDLGDNTTTNTAGGASFLHSYAAGTYSVTLTASNSAGASTLVSNNLISVVTPYEAWQLQYFGCTNCPEAAPDADPLGKGMSNTNQFLVGLNPTNPASVFRITSIAADNNSNILITWSTAGVRTNAVEAAAGDASGNYSNNFQDASGLIIIPTIGDATTNYLDVGGATHPPARFYRIRLVP
jgi:PKD repeat protein